ncbi:MAG: hypothetical protein J3Q66DRAFT_429824 [Benniella sp.]|nr:MAG: hypothetical protein J3Q66DRAFT_429824 [Benniella sp.]
MNISSDRTVLFLFHVLFWYDDLDDNEDDEDEIMGSDNEDDEEDDGDGYVEYLLGQLYTNVAPSLINRFKEREETVRVEILKTFITLLRHGAAYEFDTSLESIAKMRKGSRPRTLIETDKVLRPQEGDDEGQHPRSH